MKDQEIAEISVENKLSVLVTRMNGRLAELQENRQQLVAELLPMDAAIHELQQMLIAAGASVESAVQPMVMEDLGDRWTATQDTDAQPFQPVKQVQRTPVIIERTGPDGKPPVVGKKSAGSVKSPNSGTAIPTNVATLKKALKR